MKQALNKALHVKIIGSGSMQTYLPWGASRGWVGCHSLDCIFGVCYFGDVCSVCKWSWSQMKAPAIKYQLLGKWATISRRQVIACQNMDMALPWNALKSSSVPCWTQVNHVWEQAMWWYSIDSLSTVLLALSIKCCDTDFVGIVFHGPFWPFVLWGLPKISLKYKKGLPIIQVMLSRNK